LKLQELIMLGIIESIELMLLLTWLKLLELLMLSVSEPVGLMLLLSRLR
jgi:hypothetical protein